MWVRVSQHIFLEFIFDILYFPFWWYTSGAKRALIGLGHWIQEVNYSLAPGLWFKNLFVPMFGQRDWQGRLISFFLRFANAIVRSIGLLIWIVLMLGVFMVWLLFPVVVVYMFFASMF